MKLLRLPQVLERIPVSKSTWWLGVREGRFPKPIKLGPRTTVWRETEIDALGYNEEKQKEVTRIVDRDDHPIRPDAPPAFPDHKAGAKQGRICSSTHLK